MMQLRFTTSFSRDFELGVQREMKLLVCVLKLLPRSFMFSAKRDY